jgi:hypothetical protein
VHKKTKISKERLAEYFPALHEKKKTLQFAIELMGIDSPTRVHWLDLDDSLVLGGFEVGDHGHKGANGSKGSPSSFRKLGTKKATGHNHTGNQFNYIFSVGHMTDQNLVDYSKGGASSWHKIGALIYADGSFQFYSMVKGKVRNLAGAFTIEDAIEEERRTSKGRGAKVLEFKRKSSNDKRKAA